LVNSHQQIEKMVEQNAVRVIPRLDIKGPNLVKGIHFEGLRVLGAPEQFARHYYEKGADELLYVDVVASLYERNSLHELITNTAQNIFIPLTVSGGIRSIDDIRGVLRAGADKVSLNTAAIKNPQIIEKAARVFGSSTIVITIEAIKHQDGKYYAYSDNGREYSGIEVLQWAKKVEELGAGEIVVSSVDREGTGAGYDVALTRMISSAVNIPVVAHGGPGKVEHIGDVIIDGKADAVAVASMIHYDFVGKNQTEKAHSKEGNVEFLQSGSKVSKIQTLDLREIKKYLIRLGIPCRCGF